jgi:hypothetical protein
MTTEDDRLLYDGVNASNIDDASIMTLRRSREENTIQDPPGSLWHALSRLQRTHPEPVGRIGPLARPVALVSFAAAMWFGTMSGMTRMPCWWASSMSCSASARVPNSGSVSR